MLKNSDIAATKNVVYRCECDKTYTLEHNLKRHKKTCHDKKLSHSKCYFQDCTQTFYHQTALLRHLQQSHGVQSKVEKHVFKNEEDFQKWKEKEETEKYAYFSLQSGKKVGNKGLSEKTIYRYYICQYDGSAKYHHLRPNALKKSSRMNKKGRTKTGRKCLARLLVKYQHESIVVKYIASHNHSLEFTNTRHQPLPVNTLQNIKQQLAIGIPPRDVQASLRKGVSIRDGRGDKPHFLKQHLITLRRLNEMKRRLKMNGRLDNDDVTSVMLKVKQLQSEEYDPILIYKPQGSDFIAGKITNQSIDSNTSDFMETFIIGFQTKEQCSVMKTGCKKILCIDSTHCTNKYDFYLINLVVPDEFGKGYPIAHFICNRQDEEVMTWIFMSLRSKNPTIKINAVMTDDDLAIFNALEAVFGKNVRHLLCIWHIHRSWMRKLRQEVHEEPLRQEMYHSLCTLLYERNENNFKELVRKFMRQYSQYGNFIDYFQDYYMSRSHKWALCYRNFLHANTDTNMYVESFHNRLKTYFMERKPNKRIDDLLDLLLKIEEDAYMRRQRMLLYDNTDNTASQSRHERGIKIKDDDITKANNENKWTVKSQHTTSVYEVKQNVKECFSDMCFIRCVELSCMGLCQHLYTCTCDDQAAICKHIHKVCKMTL